MRKLIKCSTDFSQIITQDVTNLIKTIQESGCDILSFSDLYFKKYRKENHNLWQHADIKVTTDLKINTKGFIFELKD